MVPDTDPLEIVGSEEQTDDPLLRSQWAGLVAAADALVHQTEAAAMQARSLQAQVAALEGRLGAGAPTMDPLPDMTPLSPAELQATLAALGGKSKERSYFGETEGHHGPEGEQRVAEVQQHPPGQDRRGRRSGGATGK